MSQTEIHAEWQELCEEYEEAREANFQAYTAVSRKFVAIGQGTSITNPTNDELSKFENTRVALEDVNQRMAQFIKKNS
jgi:hypothetical protein